MLTILVAYFGYHQRQQNMLQRDFTDEQNMFRDAYRKFLAAEIVPHMEAGERRVLSIAPLFAKRAIRAS